MPASPIAGAAGAKKPSLRQRFKAMRNLPPFLRMVWKTSPALTLASLGLRLIRALLPVAMLYVGKLIIDSISSLDRPVMVAYLMLVAFFFIVINLLVDLSYAALDPRLRTRRAA